MRFKTTRMVNYAVDGCDVCEKRIHKLDKKKSMFQVVAYDQNGRYTGYTAYVCSNKCVNMAILAYEGPKKEDV